MAVGLLHCRARGRSDVRQEQRRLDMGSEVAQVGVPPRRGHAVVHARSFPGSVPAEPEAVAVCRLGAHAGVQALIDESVLGLKEQLLDQYRLPVPRHPPTHAVSFARL